MKRRPIGSLSPFGNIYSGHGKNPRFFDLKTLFPFQKWTKKMSKIENLYRTFAKTVVCDHNSFLWSGDSGIIFWFVTIFFLYFFLGKKLKYFSVQNI
jgi:hypothetical protein